MIVFANAYLLFFFWLVYFVKRSSKVVVISDVQVDEYNRVCLVKDLKDRLMSFKGKGVEDLEIIAQLSWCDDVKFINSDISLLLLFMHCGEINERELSLRVQEKALDIIIPRHLSIAPHPQELANSVEPKYSKNRQTNQENLNLSLISTRNPFMNQPSIWILLDQHHHPHIEPRRVNLRKNFIIFLTAIWTQTLKHLAQGSKLVI